MDKKSIIGLVLIFGIMVVFFMLNKPSKEEIEKQRRMQDSIVAAQQIQQDTTKMESVDQNDTTVMENRFGVFSSSATKSEEQIVKLENDVFKVDLSTIGGVVKQVTLKDYLTYDKDSVRFFTPNGNSYWLNLSLGQQVIQTKDLTFEIFVNNKPYDNAKPLKVSGKDSLVVAMRLFVNQDALYETPEYYHRNANKYIEYRYTLRGNDYRLGYSIVMSNMGEVLTDESIIELIWNAELNMKERDRKIERNNSSIYYLSQGEVDYLKENGRDDSVSLSADVNWVSFKQQFFSTALFARDSAAFKSTIMVTKTDNKVKDNYLETMSTAFTIPFEVKSKQESFDMDFFFGPNKYSIVKKWENHYEQVIPLGWGFAPLQWINRFVIIPVFDLLQQFDWNMGIIILILTVLVKIVLFPLAYKSYSSSAKMKIIQPEVQKISEKFPKKEQALQKQQAVMQLYKRAGVNPMAGCLPMLLQFPILVAMFRFFPASIELRQKSFLWANDLSSYDSIVDLPFNIPFYGNNISLFCLLMTIAQIFYTRITMKQQTQTNAMPGMKYMMYLMPVFMLFLLNRYSSALNYYYFVSLCFTFLQMWIIRKTINEQKVWKTLEANSKKPVKKSKWQQRMEALEKQNKALQQQRSQSRK